ncbi:MAG: 2-amino-4-hydroxy-6-hydroxymethyldihydropteridine diphosphokinase [Bryobacterales bacterium]|nr:2-amino-4-hydroxy-6-hydroxymethyldihydropteridine diphosphokinase [Bryobacterales bacterium]
MTPAPDARKTVYLALGSNLGDRVANLRDAIARLPKAGVQVTSVSSVYETKAMYKTDQPDFLNLVLEAKTRVLPRVLMRRLQTIERELGRRRAVANGPRTIDIDVLLYGRFVIATPDLAVPHPRIEERRFVLEPLAEIAPNLRHPIHKKTAAQLLAAVKHQVVRKLDLRIEFP